MPEPHQPSHEHARFDAFCDGLEEFQTLPEPTAPTAWARWIGVTDADQAREDSPLEAHILAGLVSPW